jgi:hypothetical protein
MIPAVTPSHLPLPLAPDRLRPIQETRHQAEHPIPPGSEALLETTTRLFPSLVPL